MFQWRLKTKTKTSSGMELGELLFFGYLYS